MSTNDPEWTSAAAFGAEQPLRKCPTPAIGRRTEIVSDKARLRWEPMIPFAVFLSLLFLYSLVSRRLDQTVFTAPIIFTLAGIFLALVFPPFLQTAANMETGVSLHLAELGLVFLLFTDTELDGLQSAGNLPFRLLSVGMLLTILLGATTAWAVFRDLTIWEAAIIGAILAPTDAGLGQLIVKSPRLSTRIRQTLIIEAGLNDGLCVPFLLFFIAVAAAGTLSNSVSLTRFIFEQLGLGVLVGFGVGLVGGVLLRLARRKEWMTKSFQQIGIAALPLLCFVLSEMLYASMFIAAFVAGLAVQISFKKDHGQNFDFAKKWGKFLNLSVFFLFGLLVGRDLRLLDSESALYAVLSLTFVRMLPVAIALAGAHLSKPTIMFLGWFGPRGLASIVLGLVYLEQEVHLPGEPKIRLAVMTTVLVSIFAHGFSAVPGIRLYARSVARRLDATAPKRQRTAARER
jgi:NhaP-type Na+/H+ or K+/H+ antiporter